MNDYELLQEINVRKTGSSSYESQNNDPQLIFKRVKEPKGKWFFLRWSGARSGQPITPELFFDDGKGFRESLRTSLNPFTVSGYTKQVLSLPANVQTIRIDPIALQDAFRFHLAEIRSVSYPGLVWGYITGSMVNRKVNSVAQVIKIVAAVVTGGLGGAKRLFHKEMVDHTSGSGYAFWCSLYDTHTKEVRARLEHVIQKSPTKFSIVMPVYNPPVKFLEEALESIRNQWYPRWEVCIADDASTNPKIRTVLEKFSRMDPRFKVVYRPTNGHISEASNSALEIASGDFVVLMDNDDLIPPNALAEVANVLSSIPDAAMLYSDEDKIDTTGARVDPYFKPDWSPTLFESQNMVSHLGVYRTDFIRKIGGFRKGFEGSQDYDLALRISELLKPSQIVHIPKILYHWRIIPGSTAADIDQKPYAQLAAKRALEEHFQRLRMDVSVVLESSGYQRIFRRIAHPEPKVSLIIPTRDGVDVLKACISSIVEKSTYPNYEILIIDNGSVEPQTHEYFQELSGSSKFKILRDDGPFNFSALNNRAVTACTGSILGLVNNDIEVITPGWMEELVSFAIQKDVGAVGAKLLYPDGSIQHAGVVAGIGSVAGHVHKYSPDINNIKFGHLGLPREYSAVTAACLFVEKNKYLQVGGLNEIDLKVAFNDIDFCFRLLDAGYRNIFNPYVTLYHHESKSRGAEDSPEKIARFSGERQYMIDTWGRLLGDDPYYNVNLSLDDENTSLAWPPRLRTIR